MSAYLVSVMLLLPPTSLTDAELLAAAQSAFAMGLRQREKGERGTSAFREAAQLLKQLRARGVANADLYCNLGNAHLLAGDLPFAILAYRQGLRLSPTDARLRELLSCAREQVVFPGNSTLGRAASDVPRYGPVGLFVIALVTYTAACVFATRWWMTRKGAFAALAIVCALLAVLPWIWLIEQAHAGPAKPIVVVARDGVLLRKGNGEAFAPWYETPINRGVEATLLYRAEEWLQIELAGGEIGWVHAREVGEPGA
jgi:tetratricopeptide (TPR) repeat protein